MFFRIFVFFVSLEERWDYFENNLIESAESCGVTRIVNYQYLVESWNEDETSGRRGKGEEKSVKNIYQIRLKTIIMNIRRSEEK